MLISLLTIAILGVIFLAAFLRLWVNPPVIQVSLVGLKLPANLQISLDQTHKVIPADVEIKPKEEAIPEEIIEYIAQESEAHAQDARRRRVRMLRLEAGSWDAAFRLLQREDNSLG